MIQTLGCGKFRWALAKEPPLIQNKLVEASELLRMSKYDYVKQAYEILENIEVNESKEILARMYEKIAKKVIHERSDMLKESVSKAAKLYRECGKENRAQYLRKIILSEMNNIS